MRNQIKIVLTMLMALVVVGMVGCGQATKMNTADVEGLRTQLAEKDQEINTLKSTINVKTDSLSTVKNALVTKETALTNAEIKLSESSKTTNTSFVGTELLPPNAKTGECYARVYINPEYKTVIDTVLKTQASERVEVTPAKYEWVEERVLVKEESKRFETVAATYEWVEEKILIQEAHTKWKKGNGLIEKVDNSTGEIMCLVEIPAQYKTVKKKVLVNPAGIKEIVIPAEYETIKVKKMVTGPQEKRITIPADYQYIQRTVKINDGLMEWRQVLCETNLSRNVSVEVQRALLNAGHNPGPIDGVIGPLTQRALKTFQKANNLAIGGLTYETIDQLGVKL